MNRPDADLTIRPPSMVPGVRYKRILLKMSGEALCAAEGGFGLDPTAVGLPAGRNTGMFLRTVSALRGNPEAPGGYAGRDGATFNGVVAGTALTYTVALRNDFVPQTASDQVFPAAVLITAGGYPVQRVPIWVLVPSR
jgi:hypothetical protein